MQPYMLMSIEHVSFPRKSQSSIAPLLANCDTYYKYFCQWTIITTFIRIKMETKLIGYLINHPCSDQGEQVFQQAGVVLPIQVRQGALLPDWCIWVLHKQTHTVNVF